MSYRYVDGQFITKDDIRMQASQMGSSRNQYLKENIKKWKKVGAPRTYFSNDKIHFSVRSKSKYGPPLITEDERAEVESNAPTHWSA